MKSSDRTILLAVLGVVALGLLWFAVIAPKRAEVGKLDEKVTTVQASVSEAEQLAAAAVAAKESYRSDYERLIVLGKAVPSDDDAASLIDQVDGLSNQAGVEFSSLRLAADGGGAAAPAAAVAAAEGSPTNAAEGEAPEGEVAAPAVAAATEGAVAGLPLGATVGPAGLPVLPYDLTFKGTFFDIADFMAGIDHLVRTGPDGVGVDGRLITVDGFSLTPDPTDGFPTLDASLHVTTFVTPADQGLTGGAEPTAPPPAGTPAVAPATTTPAPTASVAAPTP